MESGRCVTTLRTIVSIRDTAVGTLFKVIRIITRENEFSDTPMIFSLGWGEEHILDRHIYHNAR